MTFIEFISAAVGSSDNFPLFIISAFLVSFISLDFIHVFFAALTSWFKNNK